MRSVPVAVAMVGLLLGACGMDPAAQKASMLQKRCIEEDIKPRLKDPESIRILEREHQDILGRISTDFVVLEYTATNSFNARIRNRRLCSFYGDSLEVAYNVNSNNEKLEREDADFVWHNPDRILGKDW